MSHKPITYDFCLCDLFFRIIRDYIISVVREVAAFWLCCTIRLTRSGICSVEQK